MSEFRKGQLVAVRDSSDCEWQLHIYDHECGGQHFCKAPDNEMGQAMWWARICPAEFIWPNAFLNCDRESIDSLRQELDREHQNAEQSTYAVAMESELVQKLRKQIRWLCQELSHADNLCPSVTAIASCDHDCASCWEQASLKAVKDVRENEQG